ncbi:MAG: DUF1097 domain-containing protein [Muribaculaceae bacterium]|nr:DUF1097 domain-containing protein [Muribaculaceae bacterium]MDE6551715.1 DUF1097 domain-containing protein [Muribaculaceae bacterium]
MEENDVNIPEVDNKSAEPTPEKESRWIGLIAVVAFFALGGWSYCPWYMWIVFALLALFTLAGMYKWGQLILGLCVILWGTPLLGGDSNSTSNSDSYNYQQSSDTQSESERQYIESQIHRIEELQRQFDRADQMGLPEYEQKRISDEAWAIYQSLENKNLTREQRKKLSDMFAL